MEQKLEKVSLKRVDADVADNLIDKGEKKESVLSEKEQENLKKIFEKAINNTNTTLSVASMSPDDMPVTITLPEFMRRMKDMAATGGMGMMGNFPEQLSVTINGNHALISKLLKQEKEEEKVALAKQSYDLAMLSQNMLTGTHLTNFIQRSVELASK